MDDMNLVLCFLLVGCRGLVCRVGAEEVEATSEVVGLDSSNRH